MTLRCVGWVSLVSLIWLSWCGGANGQDTPPDLSLTGSLDRTDHETYREVPFRVPRGTHRLTVEFTYTGQADRSVIDLGLRDPVRFRGWSGGNKARIVIEEADATPSYLPGPVTSGIWKLVLGVPNIRSGKSAAFQARIWFDNDADALAVMEAPINPSVGWYRGDLHMHTAHSDGTCASQRGSRVPCPVFKTLMSATERHLDFIAITDHNATSQNHSIISPFQRPFLFRNKKKTTPGTTVFRKLKNFAVYTRMHRRLTTAKPVVMLFAKYVRNLTVGT